MVRSGVERSPTGIAVVGCGYWGPNHVRTFLAQPNCHVTAVDQDAARLRGLARIYPEVKLSDDFREVLNDPAIHAIVVATPPQTHYGLVRKALLAGKHVLCEKPLCATEADASSLVELAEARQLALVTGHTFLFNAGLRELKRQLDAGHFGVARYVSARRTNLGPVRTDVNAAFDLASHDVAVFNWLLNAEPQEVSATGGAFLQEGVHDVVFISLRYPGNRIGHIHAGWLEPRKIRQLTLVGSERMAIWDDLQPGEPVTVFDSTVRIERNVNATGEILQAAMRAGAAHVPVVDLIEPLVLQSQCFLEAIRSGTCDPSHGRFAVGVVRTLEMVDRSLRNAGAPQISASVAAFDVVTTPLQTRSISSSIPSPS